MYKIQGLFSDIDDSTYNVSMLEYGDIVFIYVNKGNDFNNLIKINLEEIIEINSSGIVVRGYKIIYDENENMKKEYYTGIFVYKLGKGYIYTKDGYKVPAYMNSKMELVSIESLKDKKTLEWQFKIDKFSFFLNIGGDVYFTQKEINEYIQNIKLDFCIADKNNVILCINGYKIIFNKPKTKYNNKDIEYDDFFEWASKNLNSCNNAVYSVNKKFKLEPGEIIIYEF